MWTNKYTFKVDENGFRAGPLLGIQQRLFKNGYIDFNTSCNWERRIGETATVIWIRANLAIGFAFGS